MRTTAFWPIAILLGACTSSPGVPDGGGPGDDGGSGPDGSQTSDAAPGQDAGGTSLASKYPGDKGIDQDPAVVWVENFEEGSVNGVTSRYDNVNNAAGMTLVNDVPAKSSGAASMTLTASGDGANATDLYKSFATGYDEWYVRWYAKYQTGNVTWHHSGVWFGGYDPPSSYPNPQAGLKPNGDDRFSVSIEPVWDVGTGAARFDTYDYWMQMQSWMAQPSGSTAYYGNSVINENAFKVDEGSWVCLEVHLKLNTDLASGAGAVLEVWKNDQLVASYDQTGPKGYWIRDKFCTPASDGTECTQYPAPFDTILDQQYRSVSSLKLNAFWPQNYITAAGNTGDLHLDDMVVATQRIGCLQ